MYLESYSFAKIFFLVFYNGVWTLYYLSKSYFYIIFVVIFLINY